MRMNFSTMSQSQQHENERKKKKTFFFFFLLLLLFFFKLLFECLYVSIPASPTSNLSFSFSICISSPHSPPPIPPSLLGLCIALCTNVECCVYIDLFMFAPYVIETLLTPMQQKGRSVAHTDAVEKQKSCSHYCCRKVEVIIEVRHLQSMSVSEIADTHFRCSLVMPLLGW